MFLITKFGIKSIWLICLLVESIDFVFAYPVDLTDLSEDEPWKWQNHLQYVLTSFAGILLLIFVAIGCICCRKQRNISKGFENTAGDIKQEFNNGSQAGSETIIERGLELEVSRSESNNQVQFEPLSIINVPTFSQESRVTKPSQFSDNEINHDFSSTNNDWFTSDLHVSRDCLKYLCEIGHGWFGKIVEGTLDTNYTNDDNEKIVKTQSVIVRILTEEASKTEKAWFLGESLPYLKLRHRNILSLVGVCLEIDPYLLLFESCPTGDLKFFLQSNTNSESLINKNVLLKMAVDLSSALDYMHKNGFSHTDLSARNCLVALDLSAKLGDYGIGVEKYPEDYWIVGDRALPIRWSAPESLIFTDTTIVTRAITQQANLWSFGILLWEIANWGKRPYDNLGDEQVIEMILSSKFHDTLEIKEVNCKLLCLIEAMKLCWRYSPDERGSLDQVCRILRDNLLGDFEQRWKILEPNCKESTKLDDNCDEKLLLSLNTRANFRLGPEDLMKNPSNDGDNEAMAESGSETEEESWRGRVERGAYTEKVKQKSKSVADLMVLTHIDSDSEAEWSIGPQITDKIMKIKYQTSGSVGDLRCTEIADEFNATLKKLRDPISNNEALNKLDEINSKEILDNLKIKKLDNFKSSIIDVELWKNALDYELEKKVCNFDVETIVFDNYQDKIVSKEPDFIETTPSPSRLSNDDDKPGKSVEIVNEEEEDRKHLSTPDDERSSDSGFRDKESCEEEENPIVTPVESSKIQNSSTEDEQLKILYELDCILDAECSGNFEDPHQLSPNDVKIELKDENSQPLPHNEENQEPVEIKNHPEDKNIVDNLKNNNNNKKEENDDEDSSTVSFKSDNSYVSFNLDEEFVAAIRNELREKLPHAQMPIVEIPELYDENELSIEDNLSPQCAWDEDDEDEDDNEGRANRDYRNIDIIYGTPLSPIMEERESAVTSETIIYKDNSSESSKLSNLPDDDVIIVDTMTNKVLLVENSAGGVGNGDTDDDDDDDDESMDYVDDNLTRKLTNDKKHCGPLPSPEEESKWQAKFPTPLQQHQDDVMSTSFSTDRDWDSQDEYDDEIPGDEPENEEDEENSSSSGEFVWKPYDDAQDKNDESKHDIVGKIDEEEEEEEEEDDEEEEFTPSAWDATLAPHRSALKSPEKNIKKGDQKKNVWFKKQRYHCVYEYPKETPVSDSQGQAATTWKPTSYADWEEMMDKPKLDIYSMDYDDSNFAEDEEFSVSSGSRPFQFHACQFLPGASTDISSSTFTPHEKPETNQNEANNPEVDKQNKVDTEQSQLGELRHTRGRLKLNLPFNNTNEPSNSQAIIDGSDESDAEILTINNSDGTKKSMITRNISSPEFDTKNKISSPELSATRDDFDESSLVSIERSSIESSELSCQDDQQNPKNDATSDHENKNDCAVENQPKSSGRPLVISDNKNKNNNVTFIVDNDNEVTENHEIFAYDNGKIKPSDDDPSINESTKNINGNILQ